MENIFSCRSLISDMFTNESQQKIMRMHWKTLDKSALFDKHFFSPFVLIYVYKATNPIDYTWVIFLSEKQHNPRRFCDKVPLFKIDAQNFSLVMADGIWQGVFLYTLELLWLVGSEPVDSLLFYRDVWLVKISRWFVVMT